MKKFWPAWVSLLTFAVVFAAAWWASGELPVDSLRPSLRWIAAPAFVLTALAGTMLGKIHDLGEMKGLSVARIGRVKEQVERVHRQLWWIIVSIIGLSLVGALYGSIEALPPFCGARAVLVFLYSGMATVLIVGTLLLRHIFRDYVNFRFVVIMEERSEEEIAEAKKVLGIPPVASGKKSD